MRWVRWKKGCREKVHRGLSDSFTTHTTHVSEYLRNIRDLGLSSLRMRAVGDKLSPTGLSEVPARHCRQAPPMGCGRGTGQNVRKGRGEGTGGLP